VPAQFILSLDCEGKWGCADALTRTVRRELSDENLQQAYASILELLDDFHIPATFAFAGAFSQSPAAFARIRPELERLAKAAPTYLRPALDDIAETGGDGWHGNQLIDQVTHARLHHEIALHGVTHVPWTSVDCSFAAAEMRLFKELEGPVSGARTFVYPRNLVAHRSVLAEHGFAGFRAARPTRSRLSSLLSEFNLLERPDAELRSDDIVTIPAGFFLNWRSGLRRAVPSFVSLTRAKRLLDVAAGTGGTVHYWFHPENIATAPATLGLFAAILREVATRGDSGTCEVLTQLDYCNRVGSRERLTTRANFAAEAAAE
jgi:peptidoglycan/xylan/chitin deacetylase (PgdA/CDA1 family)